MQAGRGSGEGGASGGAGPRVSVLLPVYNGAPYLAEAIRSILAQTFADYELIAIDDGSKDDSFEIVRSFDDSRVRAYRQENAGLPATLNRAIGLARGEYLARQDQDDVSRPERFARQVAFLDARPACALVGTWAEIRAGDAPSGRSHRHPAADAILRWELLFDNPFVHSSVMMRKAAVAEAGGYSTDPRREPPEDYELWSRIARRFEVGNIPEVLHVYREVPTSMSRDRGNPFRERLILISAENLAWAAGLPVPDRACWDVAALVHRAPARVSPEFRVRQGCDLLRRAAGRFESAPAQERAELRRRLRARMREVRREYADIRGGGVARRLSGLLRRVGARLKRRAT